MLMKYFISLVCSLAQLECQQAGVCATVGIYTNSFLAMPWVALVESMGCVWEAPVIIDICP